MRPFIFIARYVYAICRIKFSVFSDGLISSCVKYFIGKPAAAVCVCRRGGATAAFQTLQMPFQMCNMPIVTSQYWNIAYGREEGETARDIEGMQTMRTLACNMAWMLKKIHGVETGDKPEREPWTPMNFIRTN